MAHFPHSWGKKNFPGKSGTVTHNFIWVSSNIPKFRKSYNSMIQFNDTMIQFKGNTQTDKRKDGQTLFYRTLPATTRGPKRKQQTKISTYLIVSQSKQKLVSSFCSYSKNIFQRYIHSAKSLAETP